MAKDKTNALRRFVQKCVSSSANNKLVIMYRFASEEDY